MKKIIAAAVFTLSSVSAWAGTTVFGLELQKTTFEEAQKLLSGQKTGINRYSKGPMMEVSPSKLNFQGLNKVTLIFDNEQKLVAVLADMDKARFNSVHGMLRNKYAVKKSTIPHVGNKKVTYKSGSDEIELNAPHLSFAMSLQYYTKGFISAYERTIAEDARRKQNAESAQL